MSIKKAYEKTRRIRDSLDALKMTGPDREALRAALLEVMLELRVRDAEDSVDVDTPS